MRQIGSIANEQEASRFGDFLLTQGIKNHIEQSATGEWDIWIENDDFLDRGRAELDQFHSNPYDPRYATADLAAALRRDEDKAEQRRRNQFVDVRTRWSQPANFLKPITLALIAISLVVAAATKLGTAGETPAANALRIAPVHEVDDNYIEWDDLNAIWHGQVWRLVTPIFLHFGLIHLVFNMWWLFDLGTMIESRRSSILLLVLVLVTAIISNVSQYYLPNPSKPDPTFGGMSGVVYALFGYAWIKGKFQPYLGIGVSQQTVTVMIVWLFICMSGAVGNIANVAHVAGLIGGVAFAYMPYQVAKLRRR